MPKNYYLILGISPNATLDDIKHAYRRRAKEFHPDHYGENLSPFLDIQEAYSVLSDPVQRETYDLLTVKKKNIPRRSVYGDRPASFRPGHVEPLIPEKEPAGFGLEVLTPSFHREAIFFDQLFAIAGLLNNVDEIF